MLLRGDFDIAERLLDVDGIAEIPANIFAEALHGKIFIQMRERATRFMIYDLRFTNYEGSVLYHLLVNRKSQIVRASSRRLLH